MKTTERASKGSVSYQDLKSQVIKEVESLIKSQDREANIVAAFARTNRGQQKHILCNKCGATGHGERSCTWTYGKIIVLRV